MLHCSTDSVRTFMVKLAACADSLHYKKVKCLMTLGANAASLKIQSACHNQFSSISGRASGPKRPEIFRLCQTCAPLLQLYDEERKHHSQWCHLAGRSQGIESLVRNAKG